MLPFSNTERKDIPLILRLIFRIEVPVKLVSWFPDFVIQSLGKKSVGDFLQRGI